MGWSEETIQRKSEEFNRISAEYMTLTPQAIAEEYSKLYLLVSEEEAKLLPTKSKLQVVKALLSEKFAEEDVKTIKFNNGHSVSVRFSKPYKVQDKDAFIAWIKANGLESELIPSDSKCSTIAKNTFEETQQVPDGLVEGEPQPVVTYRTK